MWHFNGSVSRALKNAFPELDWRGMCVYSSVSFISCLFPFMFFFISCLSLVLFLGVLFIFFIFIVIFIFVLYFIFFASNFPILPEICSHEEEGLL